MADPETVFEANVLHRLRELERRLAEIEARDMQTADKGAHQGNEWKEGGGRRDGDGEESC